ncbi:hypothetical protein E1264_23565 [Actinomadura sp. KC216]|uniref:hypothetical protein n=1 Tax=Actinomadura sp. KC216 TaxID=2530370 RepID=UPI00104E16B9|nr:hypothetical protein [Actinomadura sp. KC216]TDB84737.1 hypothetical protein E1264_23565 [Actinomadura sp. KC216]
MISTTREDDAHYGMNLKMANADGKDDHQLWKVHLLPDKPASGFALTAVIYHLATGRFLGPNGKGAWVGLRPGPASSPKHVIDIAEPGPKGVYFLQNRSLPNTEAQFKGKNALCRFGDHDSRGYLGLSN